jgi:site-specific DNA recombinase
MTKRAVLYTRVSTDEQTNGYSLQSQAESIRRYATEHGFEIVADFAEDYTGTVPIEHRPEGKKAFNLLRSDAADAILVYTIDRLVRPPEEGDEWDTPVLIRGLARLGKEIHTVEDGQLKTDFASLLIAMLRAKSAGDERRKIVERTSRGRYTKARNGKVVGHGYPPFGYKFSGDNLAIYPAEAEIVHMIYRMYIEEHLSIRGIVRKLNDGGYRAPRGGSWYPNTVMDILSSDVYIGKYRYGIPSGQNIVVEVPRLVSDGDREAADNIRQYNKEIAARNRKQTYLLSGMVRCGCGYAMGPHRMNGHYYFECSRRVSTRKDMEPCHELRARMDYLERIVWCYISNLMSSGFEEALREAHEAEQSKYEPQLAEIRTIDALLTEVELEAEQLASAVKSATGIVRTKIQRACEEISSRYDQLKARREKLSLEINSAIRLSQDDIDTLIRFRNRVSRGLQSATDEDKRRYYEILQVRVTVKNGKAQVSCVISTPVETPITSACSVTAVHNRGGAKSSITSACSRTGGCALLGGSGKNRRACCVPRSPRRP